MLILIMGIVAVVIGFNIKSTRLKPIVIEKQWLLWIFIILQWGYRFIKDLTNDNRSLIIIQSVIAVILLIFLIYNRKQLSILLTASGFLLNHLVMMFNNGKMPVRFDYGVQDVRHVIIDESSKLIFLSDILTLPYPLNYGLLRFSFGDIIIWIGLMIVIIQLIYFNLRKCKK